MFISCIGLVTILATFCSILTLQLLKKNQLVVKELTVALSNINVHNILQY